MIKEALKYIVDLQKPVFTEINGRQYYVKNGVPELLHQELIPDAIEISTLTGLCDYIKNNVDNVKAISDGKWIINIESPTKVSLFSELTKEATRKVLVTVNHEPPRIQFGRFLEQEEFVIQTQSMFLPNEDRDILLQVAGNVVDKTVADYGDDGVTQKATIKTGLAAKDDVVVPNPVSLIPYRTFREVTQPMSSFIFRMKNTGVGVACALFEADGGAWKTEAVDTIAEYLKKELGDLKQFIILS